MKSCKVIASAYLGLGSNLGDRAASLWAAAAALDQPPDMTVAAVSSLYETAPIGMTDQPYFLNAAVKVNTVLSPQELLDRILLLEKQNGRVRGQRWGPRVLDIDILLYGSLRISEPDLIIPHPRLLERAFALAPLAEIAPEVLFPDGESVKNKFNFFVKSGNNQDIEVVK